MSVLDTLALWLVALAIAWAIGACDIAVVEQSFAHTENFFATAKDSLNVTVLEDIGQSIETVMDAAHEKFAATVSDWLSAG